MKIDGGEMVVRMLKNEGVSHIFSLSGGHINPIYNSSIDHHIRIIDTRHEQGAAMMADGWARLTRSPGVCAFTAGPGHTNALTGFKVAQYAKSPVVAISGQSELSRFEMGALQEMDQVRVSESLTKKSWQVSEEHRIPDYMGMAFRHALSHPYGPVNVNIPVDVMMKKVEEDKITFPTNYRTSVNSFGDPQQIAKAVQLLQQASKPVILIGDAAWYSHAEEEISRLAEATHIPIFTTGMARGIISDRHADCYGEANGNLNGAAKLIGEADVVLLVDIVLNNRLKYGEVFSPTTVIIAVDDDPTKMGNNRGIDIGIVGTAKAVIGQFADQAEKTGSSHIEAWKTALRNKQAEQIRKWEEGLNSNERPIHPLRLSKEIAEFLEEDDIIVYDGGDIKWWAKTTIPSLKPGHTIETGAFGCIGTGIPHSIAAKLAFPNKRVMNVNGDGSFGFNAMEFETAVRHNVPFVSVVANDQGWGMILHNQRELYGDDRVVGSELGAVRYDKVVEALGGYGELVEDPAQIKPALERAFASGKPACINVMTQSIVSPVTESSLLWKVEMDPTLDIKTGDRFNK